VLGAPRRDRDASMTVRCAGDLTPIELPICCTAEVVSSVPRTAARVKLNAMLFFAFDSFFICNIATAVKRPP
jgi:hypothetical protein